MLQNYQWVIFILQGSFITLKYVLLPMLFGLLLGGVLALMNVSRIKILSYIAKLYISVIRGTPVLLQLSICYFSLPLSAFMAGVMALSINSAAYIAEIIRSGIESVDKGQFEASYVLSIPYNLMMRDIILPQAFRNILPALVNEIISLIKESAIIGIIGETELIRRAQLVAAEKYTYFAPLIVAGIGYYILVMIFTLLMKLVEKKLNDKYK